MAIFDSQNGWMQFIFANEDDIYDLPGTVRVDYRKFLTYSLKDAGYSYIFFWDDVNGQPAMSFPDEDSRLYFDTLKPKKHLLSKDDDMLSAIEKMSDRQGKAVMVASIGTFAKYFNTDKRISELCSVKSKHRNSSSIILLTANSYAEDSNVYLKQPGGVFSRLYDEIAQAVVAQRGKNMYEALKKNMGNAVVFMGDRLRERMNATVMRNMIQCQSRGEDINMGMSIGKICDILCLLSPAEAESFGLNIPANPKCEMRVFDSFLMSRGAFAKLEKCIASDEMEALLLQKRSQSGQQSTKYLPIYSDSFLLRQMNDICQKVENSANRSVKENAVKAYVALRAIVLRGDENLHKDKIQNVCFNSILSSDGTVSDDKYTAYKLSALRHLLDHYYHSCVGDIWKLCELMIESAENGQHYAHDFALGQQRAKSLIATEKLLKDDIARLKEGSELRQKKERELKAKQKIRAQQVNSLSTFYDMMIQSEQIADSCEQTIGDQKIIDLKNITSGVQLLSEKWAAVQLKNVELNEQLSSSSNAFSPSADDKLSDSFLDDLSDTDGTKEKKPLSAEDKELNDWASDFLSDLQTRIDFNKEIQ